MLKFQYFGHLMQRTHSLEDILILGKIKGKRRRGRQRMRWLDGITDSNGHVVQSFSRVRLFPSPWTAARQESLSFTISQSLLKLMSIVEGQGNLACCSPWGHKELNTSQQLNNNNKGKKQEGKFAEPILDKNAGKGFSKQDPVVLQIRAALVCLLCVLVSRTPTTSSDWSVVREKN